MRSLRWWRVALGGLALATALGAAPAAPSYHEVDAAIARARARWAEPGASQANSAGWNALFDALDGQLKAYAAATDNNARLTALARVYEVSTALANVGWAPAQEVREALRNWLQPRVRLAWAERRLLDWVRGLPQAADPSVKGNRDRWVTFVNDDLGQALQRYDGAETVADRIAALEKVYDALDALRTRNQASPWTPSLALQTALNDMMNLRNFDVSVDAATLSPVFNVNLVTSGPVTRKGYTSQVTAGPKTGYGLMWSDDGIAFYNKQMLTSVTPIWDFQRQVSADQKGRRAAKLYQFNATTVDYSELTITTVIRPGGLSIYPTEAHNTNADINTTPQQKGKLGRAIASVVGYSQPKITQLAYSNAIGKIRSNVVQEAQEEAQERTQQEAAQRNATLAQYLVGGDRVVYQNLLIEGLSLRSRPENALIGGKIEYLNAGGQRGADMPRPPSLARPDWGVSADVHLGSVLSNLARGYLESDAVKGIQNLMIVTHDVPPGSPPAGAATVTRNVDYPTYLREVERAQAANNPKVQALRVKRPESPPDFGVDANGNLVVIVRDFQFDAPAPPQLAKGGLAGAPARVLRIASPQAEFAISFKVGPGSKEGEHDLRLNGRIASFDAGPQGRVYAINEDEAQATAMNAFTSRVVMAGFATKLQGQPIDIPLSKLNVRGFAINSISTPDPSGWIRVDLVRTSASPGAGIAPQPGAAPIQPAPGATAGPGAGTSAAPTPSPEPAAPAEPTAPAPPTAPAEPTAPAPPTSPAAPTAPAAPAAPTAPAAPAAPTAPAPPAGGAAASR